MRVALLNTVVVVHPHPAAGDRTNGGHNTQASAWGWGRLPMNPTMAFSLLHGSALNYGVASHFGDSEATAHYCGMDEVSYHLGKASMAWMGGSLRQ